jgi:hypothetical protein
MSDAVLRADGIAVITLNRSDTRNRLAKDVPTFGRPERTRRES